MDVLVNMETRECPGYILHFMSIQILFYVSDLLYLNSSLILELPSFSPSNCNVPAHPEGVVQAAISGLVNGNIMICGGEANLISYQQFNQRINRKNHFILCLIFCNSKEKLHYFAQLINLN